MLLGLPKKVQSIVSKIPPKSINKNIDINLLISANILQK